MCDRNAPLQASTVRWQSSRGRLSCTRGAGCSQDRWCLAAQRPRQVARGGKRRRTRSRLTQACQLRLASSPRKPGCSHIGSETRSPYRRRPPSEHPAVGCYHIGPSVDEAVGASACAPHPPATRQLASDKHVLLTCSAELCCILPLPGRSTFVSSAWFRALSSRVRSRLDSGFTI